MLASLACILLMYLLGGELKDSTLGLWMATLMTVSFICAGVGRHRPVVFVSPGLDGSGDFKIPLFTV